MLYKNANFKIYNYIAFLPRIYTNEKKPNGRNGKLIISQGLRLICIESIHREKIILFC